MINNRIAKMRTIDEAIAEIVSLDPNTAITKNFIRSLVVSGKIPSVKAGKKYLINLDVLHNYLYNGDNQIPKTSIGKVRPINEKISYGKRGVN